MTCFDDHWNRLGLLGPCLLLLTACPAPEADDGGDSDAPSTAADTGNPTGGDPTGEDPTGEDPTEGPAPECAVEPVEDHGAVIDLGAWGPVLDFDQQGPWSGTCTITDVQDGEAIVTSLDCSADPDGPPTVVVTFVPETPGVAWSSGQTVQLSYHEDDWNDGEYLGLRAEDGSLLLAMGYGGGDGGFPYFYPFLAPFTADEDFEVCGLRPGSGTGLTKPYELLVTDPSGVTHPMRQGDVQTLVDADGASYELALHHAATGDFEEDHYGQWIDLVLYRLP